MLCYVMLWFVLHGFALQRNVHVSQWKDDLRTHGVSLFCD